MLKAMYDLKTQSDERNHRKSLLIAYALPSSTVEVANHSSLENPRYDSMSA